MITEGINFGDIFSLVVKSMRIRFLLSVAIAFNIEIEQIDVKTPFLHGDLEEEIYMTNIEHLDVKRGKESLV